MSFIFDVIFVFFSLAYLPYLLMTGRYHRDIWQRCGFYPADVIKRLSGKKVIWVHAVSVGEVMAARTLIETLISRYPDKKIAVSTITKTGNDAAKRLFGNTAAVIYLPVDISFVVRRVLGRVSPELFIIIETELWPNLITALSGMDIPVIVANGRISPKSFRRYMQIRPVFKSVLGKVTFFLMQSDDHAQRIISMGALPERVAVTGNMKFDSAARSYASETLDTDALRGDLCLSPEEPLLIAGSTHKPEEGIVLNVYRELLKSSPHLRLLLAPRHIERASEIETLVRKYGFGAKRISNIMKDEGTVERRALSVERKEDGTPYALHPTPYGTPVLILDIMGRLSQLYSLGTVVFMGGSLMKKGGQNILEPAIFSRPIVFGPHMFNFKDIAETFVKEQAAVLVKDEEGLFCQASELLKDPGRREEMGRRARMLVDKNRGAADRTIDQIDRLLKTRIATTHDTRHTTQSHQVTRTPVL